MEDVPRVTCQVPPAGWWCSRQESHEGPCAARSLEQVGEPFRPLSSDELDREALLVALSALAARLNKATLVETVETLLSRITFGSDAK